MFPLAYCFVIFSSYDYYNVSRTLCPLEVEHRTKPLHQQILVDISSASTSDMHYQLRASIVHDFELK